MGYPENPDTIVLQNSQYPKGLREIDIWNYYQKVRPQLLQEVKDRNVMLWIFPELNKPIIRRKGKGAEYFKLTPGNYDQIITGRTVSIHSTMNNYDDIVIIDIDIDTTDGFKWAKVAALDVYSFVMEKLPIVRRAQIRYTGKYSFHIVCELAKKGNIDSIRMIIKNFLQGSELSRRYTIEGKRRPGVPNLDLSPNKRLGNFITLHSLSIWGLKCMEVPYREVNTFIVNKARI